MKVVVAPRTGESHSAVTLSVFVGALPNAAAVDTREDFSAAEPVLRKGEDFSAAEPVLRKDNATENSASNELLPVVELPGSDQALLPEDNHTESSDDGGLQAFLKQALVAWEGSEELTPKNIKQIMRLYVSNQGQKMVHAKISQHEPFAPSEDDDQQPMENYVKIAEAFNRGDVEEGKTLFNKIAEEEKEKLMNLVMPEEIMSTDDKSQKLCKLLYSNIKMTQILVRTQSEFTQWKRVASTIKKDTREAFLRAIGFEEVLPQKDRELEAAEQILSDPKFMSSLINKDQPKDAKATEENGVDSTSGESKDAPAVAA